MFSQNALTFLFPQLVILLPLRKKGIEIYIMALPSSALCQVAAAAVINWCHCAKMNGAEELSLRDGARETDKESRRKNLNCYLITLKMDFFHFFYL
jgi:hypothetical protein